MLFEVVFNILRMLLNIVKLCDQDEIYMLFCTLILLTWCNCDMEIMQVPHVTEEAALAVLNLYPTILSLAHAYSALVSDYLVLLIQLLSDPGPQQVYNSEVINLYKLGTAHGLVIQTVYLTGLIVAGRCFTANGRS